MIEPLHKAIYKLERESYQHGHRSGARKRDDDDLFVSKGAPHHEARDDALATADIYTAVVRASVILYDCQCEFEDYPGTCGEDMETWDRAVETYKRTRDEQYRIKDTAT